MKTLSKYLCGRSLRSLRYLLVLIGLVSLVGCGGPLSLLTGGGPNVAANTQIGKNNSQAVVSLDTSVRPKLRVEAPVETIIQDTSVTKNTEVDPLLLLLLIAGWLAPSPAEIGRSIVKLFRRKP